MIKEIYICDCCGKQLDKKEDLKQIVIRNFGGSTYRQIDKDTQRGDRDVCQDCADKILDMLKGGW